MKLNCLDKFKYIFPRISYYIVFFCMYIILIYSIKLNYGIKYIII